MTTHTGSSVVRQIFEEGMNAGRTDRYPDLIHPEYINHDFPTPVRGVEGFTTVDRMFRTAFPDFCVVIEDEIVAGDRVATRGYFTGTHTGEFMGMPATGRAIRCSYSDIWRLEDGKGRENWVQMDMLGVMQQLGAGASEQS